MNINGINMHVEERGDGPAVILIHGGLVDSRMWDFQMEPLAAHLRVVRYDLPGFGQSEMHTHAFSYLDDLLLLMARLQIEKAHLIGLSLGGMIALDFALEHPQRVEKLVLPAASIRGFDYTGAQDWVQDYFNALYQGRTAAVDFWLQHRLFATFNAYPQKLTLVRTMLYENFGAWNPAADKPEVIWPSHDTVERLAEIALPTLVMIGKKDIADMRGCAVKLAAELQDARQIEYFGVGHHFPLEQPAPFNRDVLQFLLDD